jgi:hypothetical protein
MLTEQLNMLNEKFSFSPTSVGTARRILNDLGTIQHDKDITFGIFEDRHPSGARGPQNSVILGYTQADDVYMFKIHVEGGITAVKNGDEELFYMTEGQVQSSVQHLAQSLITLAD